MTAKLFFRQVQQAEKELRILNAKLRHFQDIGFSIGGTGGTIGSHSRGSSRVELAAVGAVDAFRELFDQQKAYLAIIARAEQVIRAIPQEKYRQILNYCYLCGWSLKSVSDELGYRDQNSIYRAHGWALYEAQKVINRMEGDEQK